MQYFSPIATLNAIGAVFKVVDFGLHHTARNIGWNTFLRGGNCFLDRAKRGHCTSHRDQDQHHLLLFRQNLLWLGIRGEILGRRTLSLRNRISRSFRQYKFETSFTSNLE